ncbi:anaphase spindle elongation protein, putative [Candida dubliniensis CD36]|uniref:Anaphase spindle elongation protein, putative n=1 Tax=Candida dubliniensis (strain CD36 / ATCC MYA-646 / CBS 7987 / NCPF 3949 / NRRL Y-17841) TaxID=573826 RepID=B9WEH6_CANDC|nr:anaphase spindle elongation protein, putative [Candida dubliniensis CD36]CAX43088.1 anaphase spindle elongation protein, putative [Candida dubliniensis CD36]
MIPDILPRSSPIHHIQSAPVYSKLSNSLHSTPTKQATTSPPSDRAETMNHQIEEDIDDCTTEVDSEELNQNSNSKKNHEQFESIAHNINETISELNTIYQEIGYSLLETNNKKSEIFNTIQDTINNFANNLNREKSNIENECEWLRQQIRIILSMINDPRGDKSLELICKGLVFNNQQQYEDGYREQILNKITAMSEEFKSGKLSMEQQYDYMMKNIPKLSLIEQRNRLNKIFLQVLKSFVTTFKKLNQVNLDYVEVCDIIGDENIPKSSVLLTLPSKPDAEYHRYVIDEFERIIQALNFSDKNQIPTDHRKEKFTAFVLASPVKKHQETSEASNDGFVKLRDINYQLVRIIRGLRFTKITNELISTIKSEIEQCQAEIETRKSTVIGIIEKCIQFINVLQLNDDQVLQLQKEHNPHVEALLDMETLNLILQEPQQLGLNDSHIEFLISFQNMLQQTIDTKQAQWDQYSVTCKSLWEKLGESEEYITNFLSKNSSLTDLSLLNFKMELNRLYIKRSEYIESFISDARSEIEKMWDKMYYSQDMRMDFEFFNYSSDNEDIDKEKILSKHEEELENLKQEYSQKKNLFQMYEELQQLLKDQQFLIESSKDSSRLLSKNSCKILLNEEKIRKRINKTLPKLIDSLKKETSQYNNNAIQSGKRTLFINGEDFFEKILFIESEQYKISGGRNKSSSRTGSRVPSQSKTISSTRQPSRGSNPHKSPMKVLSRPASRSIINKNPSPVSRTTSKWSKEKTFNNPTTIKLGNAINSRLEAHHRHQHLQPHHQNTSLLSEESPMRASRDNSVLGKPPPAIQPLISPLKPLNIHNVGNITTIGTPPSTMKPESNNISYGKENCSPFDLSPVKIRPGFFDHDGSRRASGVSNDTSTVIGEDYLSWRDEKIKQLREI